MSPTVWLIVIYVAAALVQSRPLVIKRQEHLDTRNRRTRRKVRLQGEWAPWDFVVVATYSLLWPLIVAAMFFSALVIAMAWLYMKIFFPRGIRTERDKRLEAVDRERRQQQAVKELEATAQELGLPTFRTLSPEDAADAFDRHQDQLTSASRRVTAMRQGQLAEWTARTGAQR